MSLNHMKKQINWKTIRTEVEIISVKAMGKFKSTLDIFRSQKSYRTKLITAGKSNHNNFFVSKEMLHEAVYLNR